MSVEELFTLLMSNLGFDDDAFEMYAEIQRLERAGMPTSTSTLVLVALGHWRKSGDTDLVSFLRRLAMMLEAERE